MALKKMKVFLMISLLVSSVFDAAKGVNLEDVIETEICYIKWDPRKKDFSIGQLFEGSKLSVKNLLRHYSNNREIYGKMVEKMDLTGFLVVVNFNDDEKDPFLQALGEVTKKSGGGKVFSKTFYVKNDEMVIDGVTWKLLRKNMTKVPGKQ